MNADLEAAIAEGRRRMKQFEEKTTHRIDMFEREVDDNQHLLWHKYSNIKEDLKPVSWPLWGVVLETSSGQYIFRDHVSFDQVAKCPRRCACTSMLTSGVDRSIEIGSSIPSIETKSIIEGHRWGTNKYLYDEDYVSNPPYGIIMKKPNRDKDRYILSPLHKQQASSSGSSLMDQPNTKLVSQYWRRKWKVPKDW